MPKSENQKLKLLYLLDILNTETDDTHFLSTNDIIGKLAACDIKAERKSIYDDIRALERYGVDIIQQKGKNPGYAIAYKKFELPELKLLVESVQASKFITHKKSQELIRKLEYFCSRYEANELNREVYVANRIKSMNESIYYTVDDIQQALNHNKKISFQYMQWNLRGELEYKKNGDLYTVSPYALCLADDNYYMIAYEESTDKIKHYRVDKIANVKCTEEQRSGQEYFKNFDTALYSKQMFSMFGGDAQKVKIICENQLIGVILDRFGKDIYIRPNTDNTFTAIVEVAVSDQFFGWLFGLGHGARIVAPAEIVNKMRSVLEERFHQYS